MAGNAAQVRSGRDYPPEELVVYSLARNGDGRAEKQNWYFSSEKHRFDGRKIGRVLKYVTRTQHQAEAVAIVAVLAVVAALEERVARQQASVSLNYLKALQPLSLPAKPHRPQLNCVYPPGFHLPCIKADLVPIVLLSVTR